MREGAVGSHVELLEKAVEEARVRYAALTAAVDQRPAAAASETATKVRRPKARPDLHNSKFPAQIPLPHALRLCSLLPASPIACIAQLSPLDSSLALLLHALGHSLQAVCVAATAKAVARKREKTLLAGLVQAHAASLAAAMQSKETARAHLTGLGLRVSAADFAGLLVQAERCVTLNGQSRETALTRLAKKIVATAHTPLLPVIAARSVGEAISKCSTTLRGEKALLVVCVSATDLFAWRFSRKHSHYAELCTLASEHPDRVRLLVLGTLQPEEWNGNVHAQLPQWLLVARARFDAKSIAAALPPPASLRLRTLQEQLIELPAPTVDTPMNGEAAIDDAYQFVPMNRVPRFAQHFAVHALHISTTAQPSAFFVQFRQDIVTNSSGGVTLVALWEPRSQPAPLEQHCAWSTYLLDLVGKATSAATLVSQLVQASNTDLASLTKGFEGFFLVSDHPASALLLHTQGSAAECVRFYTDNVDDAMRGAEGEAPPRDTNAENAWHTWRMPIGASEITTCTDLRLCRLEEHLFKYALLGSRRFWRKLQPSLLGRLRAQVETRLFDSPDDLVACAQAGPATFASLLPCLRRDAANKEPQTRLVSSVEEWLLSSRDSFREEMLGGEGEGDVLVAALMNVSLLDPSNWKHWRRELGLDSGAGWTRLTDRSALPPSVLQQLSTSMASL